jgi:hypothetical protein
MANDIDKNIKQFYNKCKKINKNMPDINNLVFVKIILGEKLNIEWYSGIKKDSIDMFIDKKDSLSENTMKNIIVSNFVAKTCKNDNIILKFEYKSDNIIYIYLQDIVCNCNCRYIMQ